MVDVSAVDALTAKAAAFDSKRQFVRSADTYAAAVAAAEALGQRDCLVVANLQVKQAYALMAAGDAPGADSARTNSGRRLVYFGLMPARGAGGAAAPQSREHAAPRCQPAT